MSISYPLSMPSEPSVRRVQFSGRAVVARSVSPFTLQSQVQKWPGQQWLATIVLPPMRRVAAEEWLAFLLSLNGQEGTFLLGDPLGKTPRGTALGSPVIDGATPSGQTLPTRGWTADQVQVLRAGDYVQTGSGSLARLYKVLQDADADATGAATLDIWPALRQTSAEDDGEAIVTDSPVGVYRLAANDMNWDADYLRMYGVGFEAIEAL